MMIKAIIFDKDGTLLDTERLNLKAWQTVLERHHFGSDLTHIKEIMGMGPHDSLKILEKYYGPIAPIMRKEKHEVFKAFIDAEGVPLKPGVMEILTFLKEHKIKMAVATSTVRESAEYNLKKALIYDYFDTIVCGEDVSNGKPAPDIFLLAAAKLGVKPSDAMVVEDSRNGVLASHNGGFLTVHIPDIIKLDPKIMQYCFLKFSSLADFQIFLELNL